jgi:hypothetical protein
MASKRLGAICGVTPRVLVDRRFIQRTVEEPDGCRRLIAGFRFADDLTSRRSRYTGGQFRNTPDVIGKIMSAGASAAAAQRQQMLNAIRSFGVVVWVAPDEFLNVVERQSDPLVVSSTGGFFTTEYRYLVSYKGLAFHTKSPYPLELPPQAEIVHARTLAVPG